MSNRCNTLFYYINFQGKTLNKKISDKMTFQVPLVTMTFLS